MSSLDKKILSIAKKHKLKAVNRRENEVHFYLFDYTHKITYTKTELRILFNEKPH